MTAACALSLTAAACAPRQVLPVSDIDPSPLFRIVHHRRSVLEAGISGTLEMDFARGHRHFRGRAYVISFPDGRFRLEIPGFMGTTYLIMASDGKELVAYYPGEGKAYRGDVGSRHIDEHLPFPLPVDAALVPAFLLGVYPEENGPPEIRASLLDSGEKRLNARWEGTKLRFSHLFSRGNRPSLRAIHALMEEMELEVATEKTPPYLPLGFTLTLPDTRLKGELEKVSLYQGESSALKLKIPDSVAVTDLEGPP